MSVISNRFADELNDKRMRDAYVAAQTRTRLVNQIRALREQRGWSQGEFAARLGKPQSNVSRLENREYGNFSLKTLFELANAFDVGLVVEFVAYDEFLRRTHDLSSARLQVPSFSATALEALSREPDVVSSLANDVSAFVERFFHQQRSTETLSVSEPLLGVTANEFSLGTTTVTIPGANANVRFSFGPNTNARVVQVRGTAHGAPDATLPATPAQNILGALEAAQTQSPVFPWSNPATDTGVTPIVPPFKQTQTVGSILR